MLGYRDPEREYLGKFTARLDDVLNWLPARLTGALIVLGAALAGEDAGNAWRTMLAQHGRTASPNAGWTMSAIAGALGVTLEKVGHYRLEGSDGPLDAGTIERCFRVVQWTLALVVCCVILLMGVLHVCFA
jgi:adenosylcobinamide-phosphate synthase